MRTFIGSAYGFTITETQVGANLSTVWRSTSHPSGTYFYILRYKPVTGGSYTSLSIGSASLRTWLIPAGDYEYNVEIIKAFPDPIENVSFTEDVPSSFLYIPELNPVVFYDTDRATTAQYLTKHFDAFQFAERLYPWQQRSEYCQLWQTTDIIKLQFETTFTDIILNVLDSNDGVAISEVLTGAMENIYIPGTYAYEVAVSLADLSTGCYRLQIICGDNEKILISDCQYISTSILDNTVLLEYTNSRFHKDVVFETGIVFQLRLPGKFGFLEKARKDELYRNEKYTNVLLNSRAAKQWPLWLGDEFGLPDDILNLVDEIFGCDNVNIDNRPFSMADKPEYIEADSEGVYPKRGIKITVEAGINYNSRVFSA